MDFLGEDDQRLRAALSAFEQVPSLLFVAEGPELRIAAYNRAIAGLVGERPLGAPMTEEFPELVNQQLLDMWAEVVRTGMPQRASEWRMQVNLPEGGSTEIYLHFELLPWRDDDDQVVGVIASGTNVTEQVNARLRSEREQERLGRELHAAQELIVTLQDSLLPDSLPVLPGVDVAARYLLAAEDSAAGGDWFDAVPLGDGRLALVVGDIVGHGVAASAAMGQLRAVLATVLAETADPSQALAWADRMAAATAAMRATTVCLAVLDPATGVVSYSTCGHPPPLVLAPDGSPRYLPRSGGSPLGTGSTPVFATESLGPGDVLLLYSDGLVERPGQPLASGMSDLARIAGDAVANRVMPDGAADSAAERVCQQSVELRTRTGFNDDVTALAVQRLPSPIGPLYLEVPAEPTQLAGLRRALNDWLRQLPVGVDERAVDLAVTELVANAIEHAYPPESHGVVRVAAQVGADGVLQVQVGDDGRWRPPTGPKDTSGRGLWMAEAVLDELSLHHSDHGQRSGSPPDARSHGTVATLRHRLRHPAVLAAKPTVEPTWKPAVEYSASVEEGQPRLLRVSGPLDIATANRFADKLATSTRGGVHPVVLDLTDVEVLASAAVRVLFTTRDMYATHGHPLTIVAATGSPAAQVLDLVGLEHRIDHGAP